jgi:Tol biopolymer transport system component
MNLGIPVISCVLMFSIGKGASSNFPPADDECLPQAAAAKQQLIGKRSDYLGEPLPGNKAVIFAKGVVSDGSLHGRLAISPDGRDIFWTRITASSGGDMAACIMHVAKTTEGWTPPHVAPFAAQGMTANPMFSPEGSRLYFNFTPDLSKGWQTRVVARTDQGWSNPEERDRMLNPSSSFTGSGRVYYTDVMKGKPWNRGIYCAELNDNAFADARALPASINSKFIDYTPFVASDESYLMFSSSRPSEKEEMNLHISFRSTEGTWGTPRRMNEALGYSGFARFPSLSPDGKFLFFCGDDGNMYWVRSDVIAGLREK